MTYSKPPLSVFNCTHTNSSSLFLPLNQQSYSAISCQKERADNRILICGYRLCVCASGSLITVVFRCFTLIKVFCLHFGQNRGKFWSSVSSRNLIRVLFLQTGHNSHCSFSINCFHFLIRWYFIVDGLKTIFSYILYLLRPPQLLLFRVFPMEWSKKERAAVQNDKMLQFQLLSLKCPYQHPQLYTAVSHCIFVFSLCSRYYSQQLGNFLFLQVILKKGSVTTNGWFLTRNSV